MNILFYSPFDLRSRDTESLMLAFKAEGHQVISLTQARGEVIHRYLADKGVQTFSNFLPGKQNAWYYLRQILYLINFCWQHRINVVYSHLESANFVASIAQYFIRAKVFIGRHHIDEAALYGFDQSLTYKITYRLARKIIVVSSEAKEYMIRHEKIPARKIVHINLAYDFSLYKQPNTKEIEKIQAEISAKIILVTACRLTKHKRPELSIHVMDELIRRGIDAKLILLGRGEEEEALKKLIIALSLSDKVVMPGYVANMPDYLAAADFLLHPSVLESSCVVVKEAGLVETPVIVCAGVGDFNSYLVDEVNGFLVDRNTFVLAAADTIVRHQENAVLLKTMGKSLRKVILDNFEIGNIFQEYKKLTHLE